MEAIIAIGAAVALEFPQFYPQTSVFTSSIINNFQKMPKI